MRSKSSYMPFKIYNPDYIPVLFLYDIFSYKYSDWHYSMYFSSLIFLFFSGVSSSCFLYNPFSRLLYNPRIGFFNIFFPPRLRLDVVKTRHGCCPALHLHKTGPVYTTHLTIEYTPIKDLSLDYLETTTFFTDDTYFFPVAIQKTMSYEDFLLRNITPSHPSLLKISKTSSMGTILRIIDNCTCESDALTIIHRELTHRYYLTHSIHQVCSIIKALVLAAHVDTWRLPSYLTHNTYVFQSLPKLEICLRFKGETTFL